MEHPDSRQTLGWLPPAVSDLLSGIEVFNDQVGSRPWTLQDSQVADLLPILAGARARLVSGELGIVAEAHSRDLATRAGGDLHGELVGGRHPPDPGRDPEADQDRNRAV